MQTRFAPTVRARDEDRVHACATLDAGFADGQLAEDEYRLRVELAKDAHTLADLHDLIDDLQGDTELAPVPPAAALSTKPNPSVRGIVVRWLVLFAIAGLVFFGVRACVSDDSATGVYGSAGYTSPAAMDAIVASVPGLLGSTVVDELTFHHDFASLTVSSPSTSRRERNFQYRDGTWKQTSDADRAPGTAVVDLADLGPGVLGGLALGARESLRMSAIDSMYLSVADDGGGPVVSLYADNGDANESGNLVATLSGDFVRVTPFDPDK
ncbi:DUF1707 SHOCT-like domain-containing protein [Actinomycetes bacterium M1A6_2h]